MKKILCFVLFLCTIFCMSNTAKYVLKNEKIVYEDFDICKNISVEEVEKNVENFDKIELSVLLDYESFNYEEEIGYNLTLEEVRAYKKDLREVGARHHYERNKKICNEFELNNYEYCYVSKYSPFIEYIFDKDDFLKDDMGLLNKLSNNKDVMKIYVKNSKNQIKNVLNSAMFLAGAYGDFIDGIYTGNDINIGILEGGIVNTGHVNISGSSCVCRDEWYYIETIAEHTTKVASIIGGNYGICTDANLYSAELFGSPTGELDWLIDHDVDVINMSFTDSNPNGVYSSFSAIIDKYSRDYKVLMVAGSGNEGNGTGYIGNPGLGYNVLTVGSSNGNTGISNFSSYSVVTGPNKPTICAQGQNISIDNYDENVSGTSFSCAVVTGTVGMLFEQFPELILKPTLVISMMCASSCTVAGYNNTQLCGFNDYIGAGCLRYDTFVTAFDDMAYFDMPNTSYEPHTVTGINLGGRVGKTIRCCICWEAISNGDASQVDFTDYDLYLYRDNTMIPTTGYSASGTVDMFTYTFTDTSSYRIALKQCNNKVPTGTEVIYLSYWIM